MLEQMENIDTKLGDYGDYLHVDKQKYKYSYKYTNENNGKTLTHCSAITQTPNYKKWRTLTVGSLCWTNRVFLKMFGTSATPGILFVSTEDKELGREEYNIKFFPSLGLFRCKNPFFSYLLSLDDKYQNFTHFWWIYVKMTEIDISGMVTLSATLEIWWMSSKYLIGSLTGKLSRFPVRSYLDAEILTICANRTSMKYKNAWNWVFRQNWVGKRSDAEVFARGGKRLGGLHVQGGQ